LTILHVMPGGLIASLPQVTIADSSTRKRFAEGAIPKSFLIDKNGMVRYMTTGSNDANLDAMVLMIEKLLKE